MTKFIIGDIHGCFKTFMALLSKLEINGDYSRIILVGDLIDRQTGSRDVINFVRDNNIISVRGNHEDMAVEALIEYEEDGIDLYDSGWVRNGGDVVLAEYTDKTTLEYSILKEDIAFLDTFPIYYIDDSLTDDKNRQLVVSHSAIGDNIEGYMNAQEKVKSGLNESTTPHQMIDYEHSIGNIEMLTMWDRKVPKKAQEKYFNVFGHTPIDNFAFKGGVGGYDKVDGCLTEDNVVIDIVKGYANIDSGCVYNKKRYGKYRGTMTALEFPTLKIIQQENIDD